MLDYGYRSLSWIRTDSKGDNDEKDEKTPYTTPGKGETTKTYNVKGSKDPATFSDDEVDLTPLPLESVFVGIAEGKITVKVTESAAAQPTEKETIYLFEIKSPASQSTESVAADLPKTNLIPTPPLQPTEADKDRNRKEPTLILPHHQNKHINPSMMR